MIESSKLTKLELYKEDDQYFLKAEYEEITKTQKKRITIPKIVLPLYDRPIIGSASPFDHTIGVDIGFGALPFGIDLIHDDPNTVYYDEEVIEEYPQKMTLEEIEKKLGYKVEIVSKKE